MSDSSPSLFNSLRRFCYQKKPGINSDSNALTSEDQMQSQEESVDPSDSDYGSVIGSIGETIDASDDSIIKPVQISLKPTNRFDSRSGSETQNETEINCDIQKVWKDLGMKDRYKNVTLSVSSGVSNSVSNIIEETKSAHSISESEDEEENSGQVAVPRCGRIEDDDDDVLLVTNPRSPRPIIVSDDDDEDYQNANAPAKEESQSFHEPEENSSQQQEMNKTEEGEIFVVDDDSNSVEIVQPVIEPEVKQEIKEEIEDEPVPEEVNGKRKTPPESPQPKKARKKKRRKANSDSEDGNVGGGGRVFDSDADSDEEITNELTESKRKVLNFMNNATDGELRLVPSCTAKKVEAIKSLRPFEGWVDLVTKCQTGKFMGTNLLNGAQQVIEAREVVLHLMKKCERIAVRTEKAITVGSHSITHQPSILNPELKLMPYQMVGLNWINVMCSRGLSGILADEMGLGKTIQVIAFLAHLKETGQTTINSPHLIVVPASTLENWSIEFEKWCPTMKVEQYYGSPEERKWLRHEWVKNGFNDIDVVLTTYNLVGSSYEERKMFRVVPLHYVIFDEAHMLKNMNTQRYENLITINALHRLLLTGTPLQNNLLELMSLLVFVMPDMFSGKTDYLKFLFSKNSKQNIEEAPLFEQEQVQRAKRIMHPFILRRLKTEVLRDLPTKTAYVLECPLEEEQEIRYAELLESARDENDRELNSMTIMMNLRRMANHPLTLRYHYQDDTLAQLAERLSADHTHKENDATRILEDLQWMSDHQLHKLIKNYDSLAGFELPDSVLVRSGKFLKLDELLPPLKEGGHRVLIFSQFVFVLDILEDYMRIRDHNYLRLDGSTPVCERQDMINLYNQDSSMFVFLLSTKAGGIGINLTAADTVIIHDVDFNPYNDKQAEDRCHRMGQTRPVQIMRFVSKGTIEEAILKVAQEKLHLEKEVTSYKDLNGEVTMDILLLVALLVCYIHLVTVAGRTEVHVLIPPVVRRGSTVTLLCLHNVASDNLYSVKWYRGNHEFYRFVPKERPPTSTFRLPGLEVDMNGSSGQQVTVRVLSRRISGQFTCEVSADEPSFSTNSDSANLTVIDIGLRKPLLIPASSVHVAGMPLQINCSAQPTVPPPQISFYINDHKVEKEQVKIVKPGLAMLEVLELSVEDGPQWVRCEASVGDVYLLSSASIPILEQHPLPDSSTNEAGIPTYSVCLVCTLCVFLSQLQISQLI